MDWFDGKAKDILRVGFQSVAASVAWRKLLDQASSGGKMCLPVGCFAWPRASWQSCQRFAPTLPMTTSTASLRLKTRGRKQPLTGKRMLVPVSIGQFSVIPNVQWLSIS